MICQLCCSGSSEKQKSSRDYVSKDFIRGNACVSEMEREPEKRWKSCQTRKPSEQEVKLILSERKSERKLNGSVLYHLRKILQGHWGVLGPARVICHQGPTPPRNGLALIS